MCICNGNLPAVVPTPWTHGGGVTGCEPTAVLQGVYEVVDVLTRRLTPRRPRRGLGRVGGLRGVGRVRRVGGLRHVGGLRRVGGRGCVGGRGRHVDVGVVCWRRGAFHADVTAEGHRLLLPGLQHTAQVM